jgi:hypothetical protein
MGSFQESGCTVSPGSGSQAQKKTEQSWKGRNRRRHQKALGCGSQSAESNSKEGTSEEENVTSTQGCFAGEFGKSTSGQGSEAGDSVIQDS